MKDTMKILVVDDEVIVRRGIIKTVDWESIGCEIAGEASSGVEAIEKVRRLSPDIVITDICMNDGDGISFIKSLRSEGSDISVIVLSGHSDFRYAKSTMELGVKYYLLKPIENEKLIDAVVALCDEIREKRNTASYMSTKQQVSIRRLLEEGSTQNISDIGLVIPEERFLVANIKIDAVYDEKESKKCTTELLECIDYFSSIDVHFSFSVLVGEKNVVMIIFEKDGKSGEKSLLKKIRNQFELKTGKTLSVGISKTGNDITKIHELYRQSCQALDKKTYLGQNMLHYYDGLKRQDENLFLPTFSEKDIEIVLEAVKVKNEDAANEVIKDFFDVVKSRADVDMVSLKNTVIELAVIILRHTVKNLEEMQFTFGKKIQPATEIVQMETIFDIESYIKDFMKKVFSHSDFMDVHCFSPLVQEIAFYIMQNYTQKLSVESLSEQFYLSEGHLMRTFKKETSMTVMEFVMGYRIYIAKNLLESKKYKIFEVAEMVGYDDTKYFSKTFKKITGQTPNEYMSK